MNDYQPRQLSTYALTLFRHHAEVDGAAALSRETEASERGDCAIAALALEGETLVLNML